MAFPAYICRICAVLTLLAQSSFLSACIGIVLPVPGEPTSKGEKDPDELASLIGVSEADIRLKYGKPSHDYVRPYLGGKFYIYEGDKYFHIAYPHIAIPLGGSSGPAAGSYEQTINTAHFCYLLIFNDNAELVEYEAKAGDEKYCPSYFWSDGKFKTILATTAYEGSREAANLYARKYGDTTYLERLALRGDMQAALIAAREYRELGSLRALANAGNRSAALKLLRMNNEITATLREMAEKGDPEVAWLLARTRVDTTYLERLALEGDLEAAEYLAFKLDNFDPLRTLASSGNTDAANALKFLMSPHAKATSAYGSPRGKSVAMALAKLRWQYENALITGDEYMQGQRRIVNEQKGYRQSVQRRGRQPSINVCRYVGGIRRCD